MWLINTHTGSLVSVNEPAKTPYVAISYIREDLDSDNASRDVAQEGFFSPESISNPTNVRTAFHNHTSPTVRRICQFVLDFGYSHVWIQEQCINTANRTDLSADLNAVWGWYSRAETCYVFLADVSPGDVASSPNSQFRTSSWHKDIWALQALVAPPNVIFLARDWSVLGTKSALAATLEETTGVDGDVLKGGQSVHDVSVARRMWWASKRRATVAEDWAYALLGLFGVEMAIDFRERSRAFYRLQEEIFRRTLDQSIFVWHRHLGHDHPDCLLAHLPCCFSRSGDVKPITYQDLAARLELSIDASAGSVPQLSPKGLAVRLPLIPHQIASFPPTSALYEVFGVAARFSDVAVLQCEDGEGRLVVLTLDTPAQSTSTNEYHVKAVETTLGQCDRTWSYTPVLYRDAVQERDIVILRGALRSPWLPSTPSIAGGLQPRILLQETSLLCLAERGYDVRYETSQSELIDDLYTRTRRARRFFDVHQFTISRTLTDPPAQGALRSVSVEIMTRHHSLAPISLSRVRVRYVAGHSPNPEDATLLCTSCLGDLTADYAIRIAPSLVQVLRLGLSGSTGAYPTYLLCLDLRDQPSELPRLEESVSDGEKDVRSSAESSRASGRVMEVFPKLPSIRGWATPK